MRHSSILPTVYPQQRDWAWVRGELASPDFVGQNDWDHFDCMGASDGRLRISQTLNSEKQHWVSKLHYKSYLQSWVLRRPISGRRRVPRWSNGTYVLGSLCTRDPMIPRYFQSNFHYQQSIENLQKSLSTFCAIFNMSYHHFHLMIFPPLKLIMHSLGFPSISPTMLSLLIPQVSICL